MIIFIQIPTLFTLLAYNTDLDVGIHLLPWVLLYYYTTEHRYLFFISIKICLLLVVRVFNYTGWLVTGGTSGKGVILREKRSRKYRIKIFRSRLCFRENRLWIFARYACTLSRLVITYLIVDRCLDGYYLVTSYPLVTQLIDTTDQIRMLKRHYSLDLSIRFS